MRRRTDVVRRDRGRTTHRSLESGDGLHCLSGGLILRLRVGGAPVDGRVVRQNGIRLPLPAPSAHSHAPAMRPASIPLPETATGQHCKRAHLTRLLILYQGCESSSWVRSADPASPEWWFELIELARESSLTVAELCRQHDVSTASFYNWRRKFRDTDRDYGGFVPVNVVETEQRNDH